MRFGHVSQWVSVIYVVTCGLKSRVCILCSHSQFMCCGNRNLNCVVRDSCYLINCGFWIHVSWNYIKWKQPVFERIFLITNHLSLFATHMFKNTSRLTTVCSLSLFLNSTWEFGLWLSHGMYPESKINENLDNVASYQTNDLLFTVNNLLGSIN